MDVKPKCLTLNPSLESLSEAAAFLEQQMELSEVPLKVSAKVSIAMDEVFSNINLYSKATKVSLEVKIKDSVITLQFSDDGQPYDPTKTEDPDITAPIEDRAMGGLGIFMIKKTMDSINYEYRNNQNILTLKKSY